MGVSTRTKLEISFNVSQTDLIEFRVSVSVSNRLFDFEEEIRSPMYIHIGTRVIRLTES